MTGDSGASFAIVVRRMPASPHGVDHARRGGPGTSDHRLTTLEGFMSMPTRPVRAAAMLGALCAALSLSARAAPPVTVDFESLAPSLYFGGDVFAESGVTMTAVGDPSGVAGTVDDTGACTSACPTGNATRFYSSTNDSHLLLARTDGSAFSLLSFDAAFLAPGPSPFTEPGQIRLHAVDDHGGFIDLAFAFAGSGADGSFAFTTYGTPGALQSVLSVDFSACRYGDDPGVCANPAGNAAQFALDNVALAAPVPEPSTVLLMALGLAGLAVQSRRRARPLADAGGLR
jgi:hypothetical protein